MLLPLLVFPLTLSGLVSVATASDDLEDLVRHEFADNDGVRLHYATLGEGSLVILLHGFPDYWYSWHHQMQALADDFQVVAMDLRGYNKSDQPQGVEHYRMSLLVEDVRCVLEHTGHEQAIIIGHDWGAAIAWRFAMTHPDLTERLVILSVPHPSGFLREMTSNPDQQRDSQYARDFQKEGAHEGLTAEGLAAWVGDVELRKKYVAAFQRSNFEAMLNYYKASYPVASGSSPATTDSAPAPAPSWPMIQCSVLVIHGRQDRALNARGHSNTWEWIEGDMTLLMIPDAGHFVQHDAAELVSSTLYDWLMRWD
jgi:pimeloyl-ACP methyl ester carboxylesterase